MRQKTSIALATILAAAVAMAVDPAPVALVICAPGYPSNTKEAQPSMDQLARSVAQAIGWPPSRLTASYYETDQGGIEQLRLPRPTLALVPLPFYLLHAKGLKLTARAQTAQKGGQAMETWTLVAKKGRVTSPESLAGWQIVSLAGYAPEFIRNVALGSWAPLPNDVTFVPSGQVLSALRQASAGDNVALLLDSAQTASLATLPLAAQLESVTASPPLPSVLLCSVGAGTMPADAKVVVAGLLRMHETPAGASALDAVRLTSFMPLDAKSLTAARNAYGAPGPVGAR